jgi:hypothetical protein
MQYKYVIKPYENSPSHLCYDDTFVLGFCFLGRNNSTVMYKKLGNAIRKLAKIKRKFPCALIVEI